MTTSGLDGQAAGTRFEPEIVFGACGRSRLFLGQTKEGAEEVTDVQLHNTLDRTRYG